MQRPARPNIKDAFTVSDVFERLRSGNFTERQAYAILTEIERKPWWQRLLECF